MIYILLMCRLSPGIDELVKKLKENGKDVYLISGGFRQMINVRISLSGLWVNILIVFIS